MVSGLFTLVRIQVPSTVRGPERRTVVHVSPDHVWDYVASLVSPEEWEESVGPYFFSPSGKHVKDIDADDDNLMTGC